MHMRKSLAAFFCLAMLAFALGGCTKCGWLWNDSGHACHSETPR
ncbi:MAG: peptidylprolyl isomerase [Pseudolabrys sp.]